MLICLYGSDSYRRSRKLNSIIKEYQEKHSTLSHDHFYLDQEKGFERLKNFTASQSLFDKAKLGIISGLEDDSKETKEFFKSFLENKTVTLIVIADKKPPKPFEFLIKPPAIAQEFEILKGAELLNFIKKEAEARAVKLSPANLSLLTSAFIGDTWSIVTELEKIALGGQMEMQAKTPEFFPLIQTIKNRRLPFGARLSALAYLLENEEPAAVFNVTASIADPEMKIKMADYDVAVKSGKLEYEECLLDLVISN
ncbi:MAG TPA: hypothetical protein VJB92_01325 [Candidatus Paceibacterota bacterium]